MIQDSEWNNMKQIIEQLNIPSEYKEAIIFGVKKIYDIMPYKPIFIGICGSAAREDIVPNFSDVDLLFIHKGDEAYNILERYMHNGIKIGLTILPYNFSAPQYQDRKPWYFFRCFQKGIYKRLYGNIDLLPHVTFEKLYSVTTGDINLKSLREVVSNEIQENMLPKSLKHCHTIMKNIILIEDKKELEGYKAIYKYFYENFGTNFTRVPSIQEFIDKKETPQTVKAEIEEFLKEFSQYLKENFSIL